MGYDIDPGDKGEVVGRLPRRARCPGCRRPRSVGPASRRCWNSSPTSPNSAATAPPRRPEHRDCAFTPRASTSTPTWARSTPTAAACPTEFRDRLSRVLAHYGVDGLDRTPELERAVFRVFLAQQRTEPEVALAVGVLRRWLAEPPRTATWCSALASCSTGSSAPPSCASRSSAISPAACASAGSTSRIVDADRAAVLVRQCRRRGRGPRSLPGRARPRRPHGGPGRRSPSASSASSATAFAAASRRTSRCSPS
jgi:hypothetical protein